MACRQFLRKTSLLFLLATVFLKASWGVFSVTLLADLDTLTVGQLLQNRGEIDSHDTDPYEALHEFFGGDPVDKDGHVDHRERIKSIRVISGNISAKFNENDIERTCKLKNLKEIIFCSNLGEIPRI